jgi:hypothetical protein
MRPPGRSSGLRLAVLGGALLLLGAPVVRAWVQATTREPPHMPLHVADSNCLSYTIQDACSADLPLAECRVAVALGVRAWDLRGSYLHLQATPDGTCCRPGYEPDWSNTNCIAWREDDWPSDYPAAGLALTTLTYDASTGAILDADIELNGHDYRFGTDCSAEVVDVQSVIAHEAGHVLGLDHSAVVSATMRVSSGPGDCTLRDLAPDDVQGVTSIYPMVEDPGQCLPPHGGLNADCSAPPPTDGGGCGCRAAGPIRPVDGLLVLGSVVLLLARPGLGRPGGGAGPSPPNRRSLSTADRARRRADGRRASSRRTSGVRRRLPWRFRIRARQSAQELSSTNEVDAPRRRRGAAETR